MSRRQASKRKEPAPTFDINRFLDEDKARYYERELCNRGLVRERGFAFTEAESEPAVQRFKEVIFRRQWERYVRTRRAALKELVREFYANTLAGNPKPAEPSFTSYYRGCVIQYSATRIREHLGLLPVEVERTRLNSTSPTLHDLLNAYLAADVAATICQPGKTWATPTKIEKADLSQEAAVWAHFALDSLVPVSNKSDIRNVPALVLYCLVRDIPMDLAEFISYQIYATLNVEKAGRHLPFPGLVTELVKAQVPESIWREASREVEQPQPAIDEAEIRRRFIEVANLMANPVAPRRPGRRPA